MGRTVNACTGRLWWLGCIVLSLALLLTARSTIAAPETPPIDAWCDALGDKEAMPDTLDTSLVQLTCEHEAYTGPEDGFQPSTVPSAVRQNAAGAWGVVIDAVATDDAGALRSDLEALGLQAAATFKTTVSGWLPLTAVPQLAGLDTLRIARPALATTTGGEVVRPGVVVPTPRGNGATDTPTAVPTQVSTVTPEATATASVAADTPAAETPDRGGEGVSGPEEIPLSFWGWVAAGALVVVVILVIGLTKRGYFS